jgi:PAS domain S-box-containing protein
VDIYFFLQGAGPNELPFHVRSSLLRSVAAEARPRADLEAGLHWTSEIALADIRWTMVVVPIPGSPLVYLALSRRHTARLDAMRNQLARIIESAQDGIIGKDVNGVITSWNKGAENGYTAAEIVGRNIDVLAPPKRKHEIAELFAKVRCGEEVKHYSTERITKAGQRIDVSVSFSPIMDSSGTLTGVSTIARDHFSIFISAGQRSVRLLTERDAGAEPTAMTRASAPNMRWPNCSRHRCRRATPAECDQA